MNNSIKLSGIKIVFLHQINQKKTIKAEISSFILTQPYLVFDVWVVKTKLCVNYTIIYHLNPNLRLGGIDNQMISCCTRKYSIS